MKNRHNPLVSIPVFWLSYVWAGFLPPRQAARRRPGLPRAGNFHVMPQESAAFALLPAHRSDYLLSV